MLRPTKIRFYIKYMRRLGFLSVDVLKGSGIEEARLSDPFYLVDVGQCRAVISNMIQLTNDQGIGLELGNDVSLDEFGIISHAMVSSETLGRAANYWVRYSNLTGMLIRIDLFDLGGKWQVVFSATEDMGFIFNFTVEETLLSGIRIVEALTGQTVQIEELQLSYPAPLHASRYDRYFGCSIQFNAHRSVLIVRHPRFETLLPSNDEKLLAVCERHCSDMVKQTSDESSMVAMLRSIFLKNPSNIPTLNEVAASLELNPRTFRRRLEAEQLNYQGLINQFRLNLATEYFRDNHLNVDEVSELLGYSDSNAFRRAFKSWTGQTVGRFQAQLRKGGSAPSDPLRAF